MLIACLLAPVFLSMVLLCPGALWAKPLVKLLNSWHMPLQELRDHTRSRGSMYTLGKMEREQKQ